MNLLLWRNLEAAKHRLFYTLLRLNLPIETRTENPEGLAFDFLADQPAQSGPKVTGHDNGLITIALAEADDAEREKRRTAMGEPYRTLLGHFRHEVGHYYWDDGLGWRATRAGSTNAGRCSATTARTTNTLQQDYKRVSSELRRTTSALRHTPSARLATSRHLNRRAARCPARQEGALE